MATRANIVIRGRENNKPIYIYHHYDGYVEGVGAELLKIVMERGAEFTTGKAAEKVILDFDEYEATECIHGDIEYLYVITIEENRIRLEGRKRAKWDDEETDPLKWGAPLENYGCSFWVTTLQEIKEEKAAEGKKGISTYSDEELMAELNKRLKER